MSAEGERYKIKLPAWVWTELDRIAQEKRCARNDLFVEEYVRLGHDPEYRYRVWLETCTLLQSSDPASSSWPTDPREALAVGFMLCRWEQGMETAILDLDNEELARLDEEVKRTGRTIDQIVLRNIFEGGEADSADWWKGS